jgi:inhibitor of KinA
MTDAVALFEISPPFTTLNFQTLFNSIVLNSFVLSLQKATTIFSMPEYAIFPLGDQAVTFTLGHSMDIQNHRKLMAMTQWFRQHPFPGLLDIVVAYNSITVVYDLYLLYANGGTESGSDFVCDLLLKAYQLGDVEHVANSAVKRIPVCYEAPFATDMDYVMAESGLSRDQVIALHAGKNYRVYMIGFLPGFPYMGEVDPQLQLPRKAEPSRRVEAGSVGIAGVQTGIYPVLSPGGWQIIGRTPLRLFNREGDPPVVLEPGDQVAFYDITSNEFQKMNHPDA